MKPNLTPPWKRAMLAGQRRRTPKPLTQSQKDSLRRKLARRGGLESTRRLNREQDAREYAAKQKRVADAHDEAMREDKARLLTAAAVKAAGSGRRANLGAALS